MFSPFYPVLVLLVVFLWGYFHSLTASLWAKEQARRKWGAASRRYYRLIYNVISLITFLPVLALVVYLPDRFLYVVPSPWAVLMLLGQLLALIALVAGILQTDAWQFLGFRQLVSEKPDSPRLVVSGFYRCVRHPLYTAGLIFIWLQPEMTANRLALNIGLSACLVVGALYEERKLIKEFGQAYQEYRERTPMLIPWRRPV